MVASVLQGCLPRRELTSAMLLPAGSESGVDAGASAFSGRLKYTAEEGWSSYGESSRYPAIKRRGPTEAGYFCCAICYITIRAKEGRDVSCPPHKEGDVEVTQLTSMRLMGWKSIREAEIELRPLNVLIGANGAGKSNLVGFFNLMNEMIEGRLQVHVGTIGGAESLLHYGSKRTIAIEAEFRFTAEEGQNALLSPAGPSGRELIDLRRGEADASLGKEPAAG